MIWSKMETLKREEMEEIQFERLKETVSELKKVSWPGFKQVAKQTGIVLAFVLVFAVVIFGFERLCFWLTGLLF